MPLDPAYNSVRSLTTFARISSIATGTLVAPPLNFHSVSRLIVVTQDGESVVPNESSDDPLAQLLCDAAKSLGSTQKVGKSEISIEPSGSLASLWDKHSQSARALHPRLFLAYDLQANAKICGFLSLCDWAADDALSTRKLTKEYCREHGLPRFTAEDTLLIDVIASSKPKAGAQMTLNAYLLMARSKRHKYLTCVAVSAQGKALFMKMGFQTHAFKEGTARTFCWIEKGQMRADQIHTRLKWDDAIQDLCWRKALSPKAKYSLLSRC